MRLTKQSSSRVCIQIKEIMYEYVNGNSRGTSRLGANKSFTVYDTTVEEVYRVIRGVLERMSELKAQDKGG